MDQQQKVLDESYAKAMELCESIKKRVAQGVPPEWGKEAAGYAKRADNIAVIVNQRGFASNSQLAVLSSLSQLLGKI